MRFDLGLASAPVVSTDSQGFISTLVQGTDRLFTSEHFQIDGLTIPGNFLPLPTTFDLAPIPMLPAGTTVTQNTNVQNLRYTTSPGGAAQSVLPFMDLSYT